MSNPAGPENGKLFDWKKSARYFWKQSFPLAHVDRADQRAKGVPHATPGSGKEHAEPALPAAAAMELLKKPSGSPKQSA